MYCPYFRGKQYELITVREMAPIQAAAGFRPIIEPVRESLSGLHKALAAVAEADGHAIVIVNPHHGDLSDEGEPLTKLLEEEFADFPRISAGILLTHEMTTDDALECLNAHAKHSPAFIHAGFTDGKGLAAKLGKPRKKQWHIFSERSGGKLYQKHFSGTYRVLLKDGFEKKRNRDYAPVESFSDLHATYQDEGMDGFGDYLIVGDEYSESGGPAYAIAIHLTFIDPEQDDAMMVYHFVSERQDTPKDPAGKFAEALDEMMNTLNSGTSNILETKAVTEFRALHDAGHFPGLGYIKKLSMNHHIETLADYFQKNAS